MDQLEQLKQQWTASDGSYPKYSAGQLTGFIAKRSSSIVKWLFYIALIEFGIFGLLTILMYDTESQQHSKEIAGELFYYGSFVLHYVVIMGFIYLFYKNYKNIDAEQPTRSLMKNILKTRRTMKWYIWYNLGYIMIFTVALSILMLLNDPSITKMTEELHVKNMTTFNVAFVGIAVAIAAVMCGVFYLVYSLIYGILLRRLNKNYEELKKMEV
ncbi:MAG: hypothetical protein NWQ09_01855 [Nonlabens sp.]|nr:hypothetical protein [Nonlabens sp.]